MMTIGLIVETTFPPDNRGNLRLYRLARVLVAQKHRVFFICPSKLPWQRKRLEYEGISVRQFRGFEKYLYSWARLLVRSWHCLVSVLLIARLHRKRPFDVLHAWNPLAGCAAIFAGMLIRRRVYIDFTDFYSDIAKTDSNAVVARMLTFVERFVLQHAHKVIVVSTVMQDRLIAMGIAKHKIAIVEDGADKDTFRPDINGAGIRERYHIAPNDPVIVYHGDIKYPDGVDVLFYAFQQVLHDMPKAKLLILGGGGAYFEELKELGKTLGINHAIVYTGWVLKEDVPKCLAAADIGAMPMRATLNHECYLSFKLFEYWATGKAIITTRLKAISQIVQHEKNGWVVSSENAEELYRGIVFLLQHPKQMKELGKNGRQMIETQFDWDKLMNKEMQLYNELLH